MKKIRYIVHICPTCLRHKNSNKELNDLYISQLNDYIKHLD